MVLVMMLTFIPTTVFAAEAYAPPLKINAEYADGKVTVTVKADAYSGCMGAQVDFSFPTDKLSVTEENIICSGVLEGATKNVKTTPTGKAISAAWDDSSPRQSDAEEPLLTVTFSVIDGQTGDCNFEIIKYTFTDGDEGEIETLPAGSIGTASVTIPKSPITTVTASVDAPVKGVALDTTVDIGAATGYTSKVEWYKGNTATGTAVTGSAAANQVYTVKITLTASSGESFDAALDNTTTTEGYAVKKVSNTELLLTKTFDATADKDPLPGTVSITGTPKIGQPLTADTSALPTDAGTLTYKWYRVGTTESLITGETAKTYTPTKKDDVGKKIKVVVTAENYSGSQDATTTDAVVKAAYTGGTPSEKPTVLNVTDKQVTAGESTVLNCYGVTLATEATPPSSWTMSGIIGGLNPDTKYKLWGCIASDTVENSPATWVEFTTKKSDISDDAKGTLAGYTGVYDGNPHDAITGAAQTGYTVEYSTTDAASGFSGTMPKVTNVADSKTVWVKLSKPGMRTRFLR